MQEHYELHVIGDESVLTYENTPLCIFKGFGSICAPRVDQEDRSRDQLNISPEQDQNFLSEVSFKKVPKDTSCLALRKERNAYFNYSFGEVVEFESFVLVESCQYVPEVEKSPYGPPVLYKLFSNRNYCGSFIIQYNINEIFLEVDNKILVDSSIKCNKFFYKGQGYVSFEKLVANHVTYICTDKGSIGRFSVGEGKIDTAIVSNGDCNFYGETHVTKLFVKNTDNDKCIAIVGNIDELFIHSVRLSPFSLTKLKPCYISEEEFPSFNEYNTKRAELELKFQKAHKLVKNPLLQQLKQNSYTLGSNGVDGLSRSTSDPFLSLLRTATSVAKTTSSLPPTLDDQSILGEDTDSIDYSASALPEGIQVTKIVDLNPEQSIAGAKYCMIIAFDSTTPPSSKDNKPAEAYVHNIVGHYYIGIGRLLNGKVCIVESMYGMNPAVMAPIYKGIILDEKPRHQAAHEVLLEPGVGEVVIEKALPLSERQYQVFKSFIEHKTKNPGTYMVLSNDCISFTQEALDVIGLENLRVGDLVKPPRTSPYTLAAFSASVRGLDGKIVEAPSAEFVAEKYKIAVERIEELPTPLGDKPQFMIIPLDQYQKQLLLKDVSKK